MVHAIGDGSCYPAKSLADSFHSLRMSAVDHRQAPEKVHPSNTLHCFGRWEPAERLIKSEEPATYLVDEMMVLRAKRGEARPKYVTLRAGCDAKSGSRRKGRIRLSTPHPTVY
jgi:hypothetical protein